MNVPSGGVADRFQAWSVAVAWVGLTCLGFGVVVLMVGDTDGGTGALVGATGGGAVGTCGVGTTC